ncbi:TonB-dependent receptor [Emcibacter sp. SYSU 3D8]|uniref:TonB-dependent receptor n=1 Tax=Emcibacter sp. SYSU 3D8 TaxID=3133969 RepID=UPI0031FF27A3
MVTHTTLKRSNVALVCLLTTGVWTETATAADGPAAGFARAEFQVLDQVVTTARRRAETVQSVPGTISVLPEALMRRLGVESLEDLSEIAPNLLVAPDNVSSRASRITLRSQVQNDTLITVDPAVGLYLDGVYVARSAASLLDLVDVERVEVLNGPQGTLYGRNTTGGAITVTANKPTQEFEGRLSGGIGMYTDKPGSGNGVNHDVSAVVNIPLSDKLAARFVAQSSGLTGYSENTALGRDLDDDRTLSWRASFAWQVNDDVDVLLIHDGMRSRGQQRLVQVSEIVPAGLDPGCSLADPNPVNASACAINLFLTGGQWGTAALDGDPRRTGQNPLVLTGEPGRTSADVQGVALITTARLDGLVLKNISAWRHMEQFSSFDFDGTVFDIGEAVQTDTQRQLSTEFQLLSDNPGGAVNWLVGAIYLHEAGRTDNVARALSFLNPTNPFTATGRGVNSAAGVYGHAVWTLNDVFSLVGGARFTWERKELTADSRDALVGCLVPPEFNQDLATGGCRGEFGKSFTRITWEAGVNAQVTDRTLLFAKLSTGFKSGGFNLRAKSDISFEPFKPERVLSVETGFKASFLDGNGLANLTIFYADYTNIQRTDFTFEGGNVTTFITNAAKANVWGGEFELDVTAHESLRLRGTLGVSVARYRAFDFGGVDFSDKRFPLSPDFSAGIAAIYTLPVDWFNADWTLTGDFTWRSKAYQDVANTASLAQNGFGLLDLRLDVEPEGSQVRVSLFCKNATNKLFRTTGTTFLDQLGWAFSQYGAPRRIGMQVDVSW